MLCCDLLSNSNKSIYCWTQNNLPLSIRNVSSFGSIRRILTLPFRRVAFRKDLYLVQRDSLSTWRMFRPVSCITDFASTCTPTTCRAYTMASKLRPGWLWSTLNLASITFAGGARQSISSSMLNNVSVVVRYGCTTPQNSSLRQDYNCWLDVIEPATVVRNLGVFVNAELTMQQHVSSQTRACFFQIRRLRSARKQLGRQVNCTTCVGAGNIAVVTTATAFRRLVL